MAPENPYGTLAIYIHIRGANSRQRYPLVLDPRAPQEDSVVDAVAARVGVWGSAGLRASLSTGTTQVGRWGAEREHAFQLHGLCLFLLP